MRRILVAAAVAVLGSLVNVASPAQAASGPWSVVAAGGSHTCGINSAKSLYCWGENVWGTLGIGVTSVLESSPKKVGTSGVWASVSAGDSHNCAITTGKALYCWGENSDGEVGDGTTTNRHSPKKIGGSGLNLPVSVAWASVAAGGEHTCAITTGSLLYCWGQNDNGQIGDGSTTDRLLPKRIGSAVWAAVSVGETHTCAITTAKSLYCWGDNQYGQVGDGTSDNSRLSPKRIGSVGVWGRVSAGGTGAGDGHTCAISTGNSLYCWGGNIDGQIGDGTTISRPSPKKIGSTGVWARVSAGGSHTCAISAGNYLYCWGAGSWGQLGDGTATERLLPKKIGTSSVWTSVSSGARHTCATTSGKALYCWGQNGAGQIGDGATTNRHSPTKIP